MQQKRVGLVLVLNLVMTTGLVLVGLSSHSLGVLAAGGDFAADSTAIILGILAIQISKHPNGHPKATTYVAFINGLALLLVTTVVICEGIYPLTNHVPKVDGLPVIVISVIATIFMAVSVLILGKDAGKEDLHMRSIFLDTVSDAIASMAVAVLGTIIYFAKGYYGLTQRWQS
jgi:cobalt-zinc-cadmium efflux system protein